MFKGFSEDTSRFLWDLKFNNERTWFLENKDRFETFVNQPFRELAADTHQLMKQRYPYLETALHVSRIYRDARRLHGRGPYKENLWFSIEDPRAREAEVSLFFEINASSFCFGMGFYCLKASQTAQFRKRIEANPAGFESLAEPISRSGYFRISGPEYKKIRGEYAPSVNEWYNRKYASAISGGDFGGILLTPELPEYLTDRFEVLMPMYEYLGDFTLSLNDRSGEL